MEFQFSVDKIFQPLIEIYQPLIFFINGILFDNYLLTVYNVRLLSEGCFYSFYSKIYFILEHNLKRIKGHSLRDHVQISSKFVSKKPVPYADFEQVILVFRPEWVVQSQHMERFFWSEFSPNLDMAP